MCINYDILALTISVIAFAFSVLQFFYERNRNRKEATIHAFDVLEETVFSKDSYKKLPLKAGLEYVNSGILPADMIKWNEATILLSRIEHFAVGVNSKIYDLDTLNRMAGAFMIGEYRRWKPIIETKRISSPEQNHYVEFEKLYNSLLKKRVKHI